MRTTKRYRITVKDINGRNITTEDFEDRAKNWLWDTVKYLRETWPSSATFEVGISYFENVSGTDE